MGLDGIVTRGNKRFERLAEKIFQKREKGKSLKRNTAGNWNYIERRPSTTTVQQHCMRRQELFEVCKGLWCA